MIWELFTSPIYRGPLWGSLFMCAMTSLVGVFVFLKKRSLVSETLCHASFPGIVLGVFVASIFVPVDSPWLPMFFGFFAFIVSFLALCLIEFLENKKGIKSDAALCYVLSFFFALGLLIASQMQFSLPLFYRKSLAFLYGQVATMNDQYIIVYGSLFFLTVFFLYLFYLPIKVYLFDRLFYEGIGFSTKLVEGVMYSLLLLSIVIGVSSVGVVLLSGMLIAPCLAARQWTDKLFYVYILSMVFGSLSACMGMFFSTLSTLIPVGPMIVLSASFLAIFSLLFAPKKGLVFRYVRLFFFRVRCIEENIMKGIWQYRIENIQMVRKQHQLKFCFLSILLWHMQYSGWIYRKKNTLILTEDGKNKAKKIVRLHRLWEVYLADYLGFGAEKVHKSAEQIEHVLTEDLEKKLTKMLANPKNDPHQKPIPEREYS